MTKEKEYRQGLNVFIALVVLTVIEFVVAAATQVWLTVISLAAIKAIIVILYYMHVTRVTDEEGHA